MRTKDQKNLELLYENISNQQQEEQFIFLEEEKEYFNKVSAELAEMIVLKKDSLWKFLNNPDYMDTTKSLDNFDRMLFLEPLTKFFESPSLSDLEKEINEMYLNYVIAMILNNIVVQKGNTDDKSEMNLKFTIFSPKNMKWLNVNIKDEKLLRETIKHALEESLKVWSVEVYENRSHHPHFITWRQWREEKVKIQKLKNKLPELEGLI